MDPLIQFVGIGKSFKKEEVLENLTLDIYPGEIFGLVGKSGEGKSTLIKIFTGHYKPSKGKIIFNGIDITHQLQKIRKIIGFTSQENAFYEQLSVKENLDFYGRMYDIPSSELESRISTLIQIVELEGHQKTIAKNLSGGMQRRLNFAISLIHDPYVLILDEPTTGLDPILRKEIWDIIWRIQSYNKTIIVTSHFFHELQEHCTRVGILNKKRIISVAAPAQYYQWYQSQDFAQIFQSIIENDK